MARHAPLLRQLAKHHPDLADPAAAVAAGWVRVGGRVITNPEARVDTAESIVVAAPSPLRGGAKLRGGLDAFAVRVEGRVAVDLGASAGGFVSVLLEYGARTVYAVDVGHGQLIGSLRQDRRVVNLEHTNLGELDTTLVPEPVDVITADLSYVSLTAAVRQLDRIAIAPGADLIALVKPMFELGLAEAPTADDATVARAVEVARAGIEDAGWTVLGTIPSPVTGSKGAVEHLVWARWAG